MKLILLLALASTFVFARSWSSASRGLAAVNEHKEHKHGASCGHKAVRHNDHMDYEHKGHYHHQVGNKVYEHGTKSMKHTNDRALATKNHKSHKHGGADCTHQAVVHAGHTDYIHDGHYHAPHGDHNHEHGHN